MKLNTLLQREKQQPGVLRREQPDELTVKTATQTAYKFLTHMMDDPLIWNWLNKKAFQG